MALKDMGEMVTGEEQGNYKIYCGFRKVTEYKGSIMSWNLKASVIINIVKQIIDLSYDISIINSNMHVICNLKATVIINIVKQIIDLSYVDHQSSS